MGDSDNISVAKKNLIDALGEKEKEYLDLMKLWFQMRVSKEEFDAMCKQLLSKEQIHLHNQLLLQLLKKCVVEPSGTSERSRARRKYSCFQGNFEPLDPTMYVVTERQEVKGETPQFIAHEGLLPDKSFMLTRFMYGAWELGLEGTSVAAAELLVAATKQFLKNILTAVVSRRKGSKMSHKFVHAVGEPMPNPWLRNVAHHEPLTFHSLKCDPTESEILVPVERPKPEQLETEAVFKLAASDSDFQLLPITLQDLVATLRIYPNLLASNFIYTVNSERIFARLSHPSWED